MAQMKIILNTTDGTAVSVDVHPEETYHMLKDRIQTESGIDLDISQIFYDGKQVVEEQNVYESFFGAAPTKPPEVRNVICVVEGCPHTKLSHPSKEIFRFPRDRERCSNWLLACNRQELLSRSTSDLNLEYGVCSDHFPESCFLDGRTRRRLRKGSVPIAEVASTSLLISDLSQGSELLLANPSISLDNEEVTYIVNKNDTELKELSPEMADAKEKEMSEDEQTLANQGEVDEEDLQDDELEEMEEEEDDEAFDSEDISSPDHPGLVCRLCAQPVDDAHFIFSESGKENKLLEKINTSVPVSVHCNDLLPKQVCTQCLSTLDVCYSFAMACVKAENTLKKMARRKRFRCKTDRIPPQVKECRDESGDANIENNDGQIVDNCYDCPLCCQGNMGVQHNVDIDELEGRKPKDDPDFIEVQDFLASDDGVIWDDGDVNENSEEFNQDNEEGDEDEADNDDVEEEDASCMICGENFITVGQLLEHGRNHSDGIIFPCCRCGLSFTSRNDLVIHLGLHQATTVTRRFKCGDCGKLFVSEARAVFHQEYAHSQEGDTLTCAECGKSFKREGNLWDHVRMIHRGEKPYSCPTCGKTFQIKARLMTHLHLHAGEAPFECDVCSETFPDSTSLRAHDATHADMKLFQCDQCGRCFTRKSLFAAHIRQHLDKKPRIYTCRICGEDGFDTLPKLLVHRRSVHQDMILPLGTKKDKIYKCQQCDKAFAGRGALKHHMMSHTGELPHVCEFCSKGFTQKRSLILHRRTHTGEKPYECGECGKRFVQSAHLYSHLRLHTGEKPYQCSECDATFRLKDVRDSHQRKHTGERPFKCKVCGKAFRTSHSYYQHTWIHTGRKPYPCTYCGKAFRRSNGLKVHIRIHTGEKPHECDICGRGFAQKQDMKKHRNLHTAGKL